MGSGQSSEVGGVRVFKVIKGSPASEAGLEVFFDFILEVNGAKMNPNYQQAFAEKIQECKDNNAKLLVYNTRSHNKREVIVQPRKWTDKTNSLLGATVRYDIVDPAENQGIRVLEVYPNSPAAHAGLHPFQDFLLGTSQSVFHDIDELVEVVTKNMNNRMEVYVYNAEQEMVREVTLMPNNDWGGDGCIGCDIGTGLLHRIPAPRRLPGVAPGIPNSAAAAISPPGTWAPTAGIPTPAYPPNSIPQVAAAVPGVPGMPAAPVGLPPAPGMPAVPVGIPVPPGASLPGTITQAIPVVPDGAAHIQTQTQQLDGVPTPAPIEPSTNLGAVAALATPQVPAAPTGLPTSGLPTWPPVPPGVTPETAPQGTAAVPAAPQVPPAPTGLPTSSLPTWPPVPPAATPEATPQAIPAAQPQSVAAPMENAPPATPVVPAPAAPETLPVAQPAEQLAQPGEQGAAVL